MVVKLTQDTYENEVMKAEGTVLVDFYADWCGPCKMQGPIVEQLAEERTDVKFCKLNIDEAMQIAMSLGITSIPTIMVVKDGEITFKQAGLMQKAVIILSTEELSSIDIAVRLNYNVIAYNLAERLFS